MKISDTTKLQNLCKVADELLESVSRCLCVGKTIKLAPQRTRQTEDQRQNTKKYLNNNNEFK